MGLLDRLLGVPDWAGMMTAEEYTQFSNLLRSSLAKRSLPTSVRSGMVRLDRTQRIGFGTLARRCKLLDRDSWERVILEYLDVVLSPTSDEIIARLQTDFALARPYLRVQLLPRDMRSDGWEEGLNFRPFADDLVAALVYDLPETVPTVPSSSVRAWGKRYDELFEIAAEQVRADPALQPVEHDDQIVGCDIYRLIGDSFFVCSQALWIEQFPEAQAARGVLVSIPARETLQFSAIRDSSAVTALEILALAGGTLYEQLPGALSPQMFWVRAGDVVSVPVVKKRNGGVAILPPAELLAAMSGLPARAS